MGYGLVEFKGGLDEAMDRGKHGTPFVEKCGFGKALGLSEVATARCHNADAGRIFELTLSPVIAKYLIRSNNAAIATPVERSEEMKATMTNEILKNNGNATVTYEKPQIDEYTEKCAEEWAVSDVSLPEASYSKDFLAMDPRSGYSCHCTNGQSRVSY